MSVLLNKMSHFGGTAYLGIPFNTSFQELTIQGIRLYGTNNGASRNNNLALTIYSETEEDLAKWFKAEAAMVLSSGYLAAQLVVQRYFTSYRLIYAPETHPALWIGQPSAPHVSYTQWTDEAINSINQGEDPVLLITNSLNNIYPEIYDFNWLRKIEPHREVCLLVDDSHGLGILGTNGEGVFNRIPKLPNVNVIVVASMAKGLGIDAGVILGPKSFIEEFRSSPIYAGSSPPSPAMMYAWQNGQEIFSEQLQKLRSNLLFFTSLIEDKSKISWVHDFPVFRLEDPNCVSGLNEKGFQLSSFSYPDPQSPKVNRIVISSNHEHHHLKLLADYL